MKKASLSVFAQWAAILSNFTADSWQTKQFDKVPANVSQM